MKGKDLLKKIKKEGNKDKELILKEAILEMQDNIRSAKKTVASLEKRYKKLLETNVEDADELDMVY